MKKIKHVKNIRQVVVGEKERAVLRADLYISFTTEKCEKGETRRFRKAVRSLTSFVLLFPRARTSVYR